ncbi:hypothetical protein [Brevundimonas sp.]|uniref:hypothetical protein n=1 Tax=Brevundimonas sp. TaxID=1871086 RepID=UPI00273801AC|nr:hypothetical protein [Brevundimonas sp.]MDP3801173.1 hypothetical protein [Brevundimonas sp.]
MQDVTEDDHGWDLLVEFPPRIDTAFPDLDPPLTRCLIQVKSTQSRRTSTRVKLSNALKFANDTTPCFVVLATYPTGPKKPEALYLRHIWATDMAQALRAARETASEGRPLHRTNLPIIFKAMERVDEQLAEAILDVIGREGSNYAQKKKTLADSLGYEAGWGRGQLVLADGHGETDLEDLMLGLRSDLPIQSFATTEVRFGIDGPTRKTGPGRLSVDIKPSTRCVLTLRRRDTGEELHWPGGLFTTAMDWLPVTSRRIRVAAGPLELVVSGAGEVRGDWSAPLSAPRSLDDLERDAVFRSWMDGSTLDLEVWTERGSLPASNMVFKGERPDDDKWPEAVEAIRALSRAVSPERRPADLRVSMETFFSGLDKHSRFASLLKPDAMAIRIVNETELMVGMERATHILFPWVSQVGDYFIVSVIERAVTSSVRQEQSCDFTTVSPKLLRGTAIRASEATESLVASEVQWVRDRADESDKSILSYHPQGNGVGTLILNTPD